MRVVRSCCVGRRLDRPANNLAENQYASVTRTRKYRGWGVIPTVLAGSPAAVLISGSTPVYRVQSQRLRASSENVAVPVWRACASAPQGMLQSVWRSYIIDSGDYCGIIPIVRSHSSTNRGHWVIGSSVRRSPNAWPPCAYKCISTGTPA
jgi:hypothetical protein